MSLGKVGFIGAGKMASAIASGIIKEGKILSHGAQDVTASCPLSDNHLLEPFKNLGCKTTNSNIELVQTSDIIILATKPYIVSKVLKEICQSVDNTKLIISIAAGITIKSIEGKIKSCSKVIRVMPNTPSLVQQGTAVYSYGSNVTKVDAKVVEKIFSGVGECYHVDESMIDAVTGISGSGPAYMYMIIEAMADAGVKQGLPRDLAYKLAAKTMVGAGSMVLKTGQHPAILKDDVCSPGGSTITAVDILERRGVRTAMMQAVEAATEKCHSLANASK